MESFKLFIQSNYIILIFAFVSSFVFGFLLSLFAAGINREGRKKGFRSGSYRGTDKQIDKELLKEYEDGMDIYLEDNIEHHANKKFVNH